jgi:hypothetical protein
LKEFSIKLGGQDRRIRYTSLDAVKLFNLFGKPLARLLREDVWALNAAGKVTAETRPDVVLALLHIGMQHDVRQITFEKVAEWVDQHLEAGGDVAELTQVAVRAAYYSGIVIGRSVDLPDGELEGGKADGPAAETPRPAATKAAE